MSDSTVDPGTEGTATLDPHALDGFSRALHGRLLTPGSAEYDEARSIWNAMIDRRPAVIVQCQSEADVIHALAFAREQSLPVAIRGGGHNIAGNALCDAGLVIDMTRMRAVHIDPDNRTARVEAGATLGEFDAAAQAFGLATPVGINSTTGIAGLTLGGGFGWLSRSLGLTIDNLLSADMVTAEGKSIRASHAEHSDLFWAIRGGGGNFGVVTSFEFRLHPVGPEVLAGLVIHPLEDARKLLRFYREFMPSVSENLSCWFVTRKAPPMPFLPEEWHGRDIIALAMLYNGPVEEGEKVAAPLRGFGNPLADVVGPVPYTAWQTILDPGLTAGFRNYWKSHNFAELSDGLIDVLIEFARTIPDPETEMGFAQLGGAVSRVPADATAYIARDAQYVLNVHGRWSDPDNDTACIAWTRALFDAARPFASQGAYVNFLTEEEGGRVRAAYGSNYDRLVEIKRRYDPENVFRFNQNIRP